MASSRTSSPSSITSRLQFRAVQPLDIPRCYQLEESSCPPEYQTSISTLRHRQHYAAPFFRCVLLKNQSDGLAEETAGGLQLPSVNEDLVGLDGISGQATHDEASHHVHHSLDNLLIGYICGTRCNDYAPAAHFKPSNVSCDKNFNREKHLIHDPFNDVPQSQPTNGTTNIATMYPYPMKHEPNGPYLAIHSIVVQSEYRRLGVARCLLENYIKSIESYNAEADSVKSTISKRGHVMKEKVRKRPTKIAKIILVTKSHLLDFFVSMGFRWKATISLGKKSIYELERDVRAVPRMAYPPPPLNASLSKAILEQSSSDSIEQDCYLVDAFANPRKCGSGNAAAVVVLDGPPSKLIADHLSKINHGNNYHHHQKTESSLWGMMNEQLNELLSNVIVDEEEEEELAEMRADVWMHFVAREFHQPATAFVWPLYNVGEKKENGSSEFGSNHSSFNASDDESLHQMKGLSQALLTLNDKNEDTDENKVDLCIDRKEKMRNDNDSLEIHHYIRFYTRAGIEVDMCAHATLAAASVLFRRYAEEKYRSTNIIRNKETILAFHSRKDIILQAVRAPPVPFEESSNHSSLPSSPNMTESKRKQLSERYSYAASISLNSASTYDSIKMPNIIRIAMEYPWRVVNPVPPGPTGQGAVIAMLRRAFFGAWSVVSPEDEDNDHETDELAFTLSVHHILFIGVTVGGEDLLIELTVEGFDLLSGRSVDYNALKQGWNGYTRGVIMCCEIPESAVFENGSAALDKNKNTNLRAGTTARQIALGEVGSTLEGLDFRSRYFEPKVGVNEDPVSGWPHCALGPYFGARQNKQRLVGIQESDRTGIVECILKENEQRVCIIGSTVTTVTGKLQMQA